MRARNIKPGFYKNEDLAECSVWARLIFPGLWMMADRDGRLEDRPKRIKAELLPFDAVDVEPLLQELAARGFIQRYEVDGRSYIEITNFAKHQTPHVREQSSGYPPPPSREQGSLQALTHFTEVGEIERNIEHAEIQQVSKSPEISGLAQCLHQTSPADSVYLNPESVNPLSEVTYPVHHRGLSLSDPPTVVDPPPARETTAANVTQRETASSADPPLRSGDAALTRKGLLCRRLRAIGIDAAPHLAAWEELLPAYTDDDILLAAEATRQKRPNARIHLNYLVPILRDRSPPSAAAPRPRKFDPVEFVNRNRISQHAATVIDLTAYPVARAASAA